MATMKDDSACLKIVLLGDTVGKTCLMQRFCTSIFPGSPIATIGCDFRLRKMVVDGEKITLMIWDTASHERFSEMIKVYLKNAKGAMVVYDVSNESTFANVERRLRHLNENAPKDIEKMLVGNKCDVASEHREVSREQGEEFALEHGLAFIETSAKANIRVDDPFITLTKRILAKNKFFIGNTDSATEVKHVFPKVINALCVRIHPAPLTDYPLTGLVGMRFDLKGCVDNVCPESPERIITPSIDSSLALRLWPGSYTKAESQSACVDDGGKLVILGSEEKERIVLNMIKGCAIYAGHVFWVDGAAILPGDATAEETPTHPCLFLDETDEKFPIGIADCSSRIGYICEFTME